jgi:hypothetical protein
MTLNSISEQELRSMLSEGQTLYKISRHFNMTVNISDTDTNQRRSGINVQWRRYVSVANCKRIRC